MQVMFKDGSVMVCGRLGKDVEVKKVGENSKTLAQWSMAVGENSNGETVWAYCQAWHNTARAASVGKKGDIALCVGKIQTNDYNGKTYKNLACEYVCFMPNVPAQPEINRPQFDGLPDGAELLDDVGVPF